MDTPVKKPANSMANIAMVTANAITNLKKYRKRKGGYISGTVACVCNCIWKKQKLPYFLSSLSYCSCVKSKGKLALTLFSCLPNTKSKDASFIDDERTLSKTRINQFTYPWPKYCNNDNKVGYNSQEPCRDEVVDSRHTWRQSTTVETKQGKVPRLSNCS